MGLNKKIILLALNEYIKQHENDDMDRSWNAILMKREIEKLSIIKASGYLLMNEGGNWLGTARNWIQRKFKNGETVMWGSHDWLEGGHFCVRDIETLAADIAASTINEFLGNE